MKACRRLAAAMMLGVAALAAGPAHADEQEDPATVETARSLFSDGSAHFHAGRWAAALAAFQRSHALVASPNTMLMMARSLRELGRPVDAAEAFDAAKADAARKVAAGEAKYAPTERAAAEEGRKVRAGLGQIRIRVAQPEGASLHVDGAPVTLDGAGTASLLHPPGNASVVVTDARGGEQRQAVTVLAGSTVEMAFAGDAPPRSTTTLPPSPAPPPERTAGPAWVVPAALASGVLTLAGTGVFIGFGSSSHSTYESLAARCGPGTCGPAERAEADAGERQQTIANVGLAVAGAAAIATIAFVVVALTSPGR